MDKAARLGIRIADLLDKDTFYKKLMQNVKEKNRLFEKIYEVEPVAVEEIFDEYYEYGQQMAQYVCDTSVVLNDALDAGKRDLFACAHGVMLYIVQGTYTFLNSYIQVDG